MTTENKEIKPVSEMIKDKPSHSFRDPFLLILTGILIIGGGFWQLNRQMELARFLPEDSSSVVIEQTIEGVIFGIIIGLVIFISSMIMHFVNRKIGGVIGFIFSGLGFFVPGTGFYIGPILGIIIGASTVMTNKPPDPMDPNEIL